MISTETGFGSDADIIFQKQDSKNPPSDHLCYIVISPAYRSAIQRRFPAVLKRDGLAVSNHVLYAIDRTNPYPSQQTCSRTRKPS